MLRRPHENLSLGFSKVGKGLSILSDISEVRQGLIEGLLSVENEEVGWDDPTGERSQSLWTCLEVCTSFLDAGVPVKHLDAILSRIDAARTSHKNSVGWESESLPGLISTYLTSDAGLLFLTLGRSSDLATTLETLGKMQNYDGGWGVCSGDNVSKTRPTAFVLRLYANCLKSPWAFKLLNLRSYIEGVNWINEARIDRDGGWGNSADTPPSNVSATAIALDALLLTRIASEMHPNLGLPVRESVIRPALTTLISAGKDGRWRGPMEEYGIKVPGELLVRRHAASGMGTLIVARVLAKSAYLRFISPEEPHLYLAVEDIIDRCQPYLPTRGRWIVPSDQEGPPTSWNSAFALDALNEFEQLYMHYLRNGVIERRILQPSLVKSRRWQRIAIVILTLLGIVVLVPRLGILSSVVTWFDSQSAWMQGVIMALVTLAIDRAVAIAGPVAKSIWSGTRGPFHEKRSNEG